MQPVRHKFTGLDAADTQRCIHFGNYANADNVAHSAREFGKGFECFHTRKHAAGANRRQCKDVGWRAVQQRGLLAKVRQDHIFNNLAISSAKP